MQKEKKITGIQKIMENQKKGVGKSEKGKIYGE
jgi:hypothetical protein